MSVEDVATAKAALLRELDRLAALPNSREDWRDLYDTIEAYKRRCLARRVATSPQRDALVTLIRGCAEAEAN